MNFIKEHDYNSDYARNFLQNNGYLDTCFIDPGIVNCGVRITRFHMDGNKIETLFMDRLCFGKKGRNEKKKGKKVIKEASEDAKTWFLDVIQNSTNLLINNECFRNSHVFLVEKQIDAKTTSEMIRMYQHFISLAYIVNSNACVVLVEPQFKSRHFGVVGLDKPLLKKWAIVKAGEILEARCDEKALSLIRKQKKKDDVSDTVCYDEAYHSTIFLELFI